MPNTVQFHRVLRATPERIYRAFLDQDAMVKWLPPNGFTGKVHYMDPRVGIVQEGVPDVIPPDACTLGWQESLMLLGNLVEAEIPD
jgi:uncharacterized protein YndB with AHSA1/START domain